MHSHPNRQAPASIHPEWMRSLGRHRSWDDDDEADDKHQANEVAPQGIPKQLLPRAKTIHLCSGPERKDSYSAQAEVLGIDCTNIDFCLDASMDLTDDACWDPIISDVVKGVYEGAQMDPQCSTFSRVRGKHGGPRPLRAANDAEIRGRRDLSPEEKLKVDKDNILAKRMAITAHELMRQDKPWIIENPAHSDEAVSIFNLPEYRFLRKQPGVFMKTFVQCPTGSYSTKPTTVLFYGTTIEDALFPRTCPHKPRWWRFTSGKWLWAAHPPAIGKIRAVVAQRWHPRLRREKLQ